MCEEEKYGVFLDNIIGYLELKNGDGFYETFRKKLC